MTDKSVICIQTDAFRLMLDELLTRIDEKFNLPREPKWITSDEALKLLGVKSKTTLLMLRNEGKIRYSQPQHKIILYDRDSILHYLEKNAKEIF